MANFLVIRKYNTGCAGEGFDDIVITAAPDAEAAVERVRTDLLTKGKIVASALTRSAFRVYPTDVDYWSYYS